MELNLHYGWEVYWGAEALMGDPGIPVTIRGETVDANKDGKPFDPHLRTTRIVAGLRVQAECCLCFPVPYFCSDRRGRV